MSVEELPKTPQTNSPGEQLRQARERAGVSLESIAERTLISLHKLRALERDDFAGVGGRAYATGYTRAYARVIGIDAKDIIGDIDAVLGAKRVESEAVAASHRPAASPMAAIPWFYPILAAALVLLLIVVVVLFTGDEPQADAAAVTTAAEPAVRSAEPVVPQSVETKNSATLSRSGAAIGEASGGAELDVNASPQASASDAASTVAAQALQPASDAPGLVASGSASDVAGESDAVDTNTAEPAPLATALRQNAATNEPAARIEQNPNSTLDLPAQEWGSLRLAFHSECWLEVSDATGRTLVADLAKPGQTREIKGVAPFNVVLGDATAAAEIAFNGEPVPFTPRPGRRVLHLTIGE